MASCTYAGQTSTFTYGADGLRRRMVTGNKTVDYLLDGQNVVRELTTENGQQNITATYLLGPRGPEYKRDGNGNVQWYLYDGLGSVVGLVDSSGNVTNTRKYDVYGAPRNAQTGSAHCFVGSLGHTSDAETGLIYMRARYYDPATGRFVSQDPAVQGTNWFCYAESAPTIAFDPDGRMCLLASVALGAGLGTGFSMLSQWALYGDIDFGRVVTAAIGGAAGGAAGYGLTQLFGGGALSAGQKLLRWAGSAGVRVGVTAGANHLGDIGGERQLNGPLGKVMAAYAGNNLLLEVAVRFLEEGVQGLF